MEVVVSVAVEGEAAEIEVPRQAGTPARTRVLSRLKGILPRTKVLVIQTYLLSKVARSTGALGKVLIGVKNL